MKNEVDVKFEMETFGLGDQPRSLSLVEEMGTIVIPDTQETVKLVRSVGGTGFEIRFEDGVQVRCNVRCLFDAMVNHGLSMREKAR